MLSIPVKEDTIFGAARKVFGPSYFVTALVNSGALVPLPSFIVQVL